MDWIYKGKTFVPPEDFSPEKMYGFIYQIRNTENDMKYIGKKFFYSAKTKQVKGKKKKYKALSNWQTYYGSSDNLTKDVLQLGHENFKREILHLCLTKGECGYLEAKEQFRNNVLETDNYYNSWIMVRVRKDHIKGYNARILTEYK